MSIICYETDMASEAAYHSPPLVLGEFLQFDDDKSWRDYQLIDFGTEVLI